MIGPRPRRNVDDFSDAFGDVFRPDLHRQRLEILDIRGRLLSWFPSGDRRRDLAGDAHDSPPAPAAGPLKEIRYYNLTRATIDLPFEFTDIPMP